MKRCTKTAAEEIDDAVREVLMNGTHTEERLTMKEFNEMKRILWWSEKVDFVLTFYRKWPFITFRRATGE